MQREVSAVAARDAILDYITRLTMATRAHAAVEVGVSPRGALFLDRAAKAWAYMEGRDYVTGAYNAVYLNEQYRPIAERAAMNGTPVGVVMVRVNEYWQLREHESDSAANCCLNMAAGILQLAVGPDHDKAVLARLNDGFFAIVTIGTPAARMAQTVREAMNDSRREFNISLSRRGSFTVKIASAEWGETASWDMTLSLAQQRL